MRWNDTILLMTCCYGVSIVVMSFWAIVQTTLHRIFHAAAVTTIVMLHLLAATLLFAVLVPLVVIHWAADEVAQIVSSVGNCLIRCWEYAEQRCPGMPVNARQAPAAVANSHSSKLVCIICCHSRVTGWSSTICGHVFCTQCMQQIMQAARLCPICSRHLAIHDVHPLYV